MRTRLATVSMLVVAALLGGRCGSDAVATPTAPTTATTSAASATPAAACQYVVAPYINRMQSSIDYTVSTSAGCTWTAVSNSPYITITAGSSGTGSGAVSYDVTPLRDSAGITGTITIAGQVISVDIPGDNCYEFNVPATVPVPRAGGVVSVSVATRPLCTWKVFVAGNGWIVSAVSWDGESLAPGKWHVLQGSGDVLVTVTPNPGSVARSEYAEFDAIQLGGPTRIFPIRIVQSGSAP